LDFHFKGPLRPCFLFVNWEHLGTDRQNSPVLGRPRRGTCDFPGSEREWLSHPSNISEE